MAEEVAKVTCPGVRRTRLTARIVISTAQLQTGILSKTDELKKLSVIKSTKIGITAVHFHLVSSGLLPNLGSDLCEKFL